MLGIDVRRVLFASFAALYFSNPVSADDADRKAHQEFVKQQASELRRGDTDPTTVQEWQARRSQLRSNLTRAWGGFPKSPCPLNPQILGQVAREGYRVERIVFQTLPEVLMTANAYVPEAANSNSRVPAVLCVHGHWAGAKQDPVVQSRCIGLVKLGFFVLSVDAFGAGERAIGKKLGEYHGEMTGALLLPIGRPLSGMQVYENMRAVDYLQSRPEVDPQRIGITGASGGGNQTMYAGGFDERFRCVVPTCSVGTYRAYLSAACCMCEVVPGALSFTEEGDILGLAADRGLMVTSATKDAFQFSVEQAMISVARASQIAKLLGAARVQHTIIESAHHYNQPMREAMYGWMTLHLKGRGNGSPIAEPTILPEEPEVIRCYPGASRPEDFLTIPRFALREARRQLQERAAGADRQLLDGLQQAKKSDEKADLLNTARQQLIQIMGGFPSAIPLNLSKDTSADGLPLRIVFDAESGIRLSAYCDPESEATESPKPRRPVLLLDLDQDPEKTLASELAHQLRAAGWRVVAPELRATGRLAYLNDKIGQALDHNSAEWSLWIGRPLLGQWVWDVRRAIDALAEKDGVGPSQVAVVGVGSAGTIALTAAALDTRIERVAAIESLASYVSDSPYRGQRLGLMVPNMLNRVGDIPHVAALVAPRTVVMAGCVSGAGESEPVEQLKREFQYAQSVFSRFDAATNLRVVAKDQAIEALNN